MQRTTPPTPRIEWGSYADGEWWLAVTGVDFEGDVELFRRAGAMWVRRRGKRLQYRTVPEGVKFRIIPLPDTI